MAKRDSLISTFLVFAVYPCITNIDTSLPIINQHDIVMCKAIKKVKRFYASCQVNKVLNI